MKIIKGVSLLLFLILNVATCFGQSKQDSILNKKVTLLQSQITEQNKVIEELKIKQESNAQTTGQVISDTGNYLTWTGIIFTIAALFFGGTSFIAYKWAKEAKAKAAAELVKIKKIKTEVEVIKTELEPVKKDLLTAEQAQIKAKSNFDAKAEELIKKVAELNNSLEANEEKWKIEKQNIYEYSIACEKLDEGAITFAQALFDNILKRDKHYFHASCKIAMCLSSVDDDVAAIMAISELIVQRPKEPTIHSTKGVILRRLGRYDEAIESFQKVIVDGIQGKKSAFTHIGYCYLYSREYDQAMEYFEKGKIDKSSPAFYGLVKAHLLKTKEVPPKVLEEAISVSRHDLMENPNYPYHNFGAAFLLLCQNSGNGDFRKHLTGALACCRNLGILKEQLFEYQLMRESGIKLDKLDETIDVFAAEIGDLKTKIKDYKKVYNISTN